MSTLESGRNTRLVWEASSKHISDTTPSRYLNTWRGADEHSDDDIFYATETQLPAPRFLNCKNEPVPTETHLDYLFPGNELDHIEEQIVQEVETLNARDDRVDSGYEDVGGDESGTGNNLSAFHDSGLSSSYCDSKSDEHEFTQVSGSHNTEMGGANETAADDARLSREDKLIRRKSCPEPSRADRVSIPKQYSLAPEGKVHSKEHEENTKTQQGPTLQEITAMTRKISRPLLHKEEALDYDDDPYNDMITWSHASVAESVPSRKENHEAQTDADKYSHLTAQTRKATKPKVKDLDIKPERHVQRPVAHVQSPTVPALSPDRERFSFTRRSSSSNSTSSLSDIYTPVISAVDPCFRCGRQVYALDKVGPIRRVLFHKQCFRCIECNSVLNLKNYCQNSNDKSDKQIYCKNHEPAQAKAHVGLDDRNINITLNYPKLDRVNSNIRGSEEERAKCLNQRPIQIRGAATTPKLDIVCGGTYGFSYTGGDTHHDAGLVSPFPHMRSALSPREMSVEEVEPRRVWTRSAINAATLDLTSPNPGRNKHHFYSYGSRAFSQM